MRLLVRGYTTARGRMPDRREDIDVAASAFGDEDTARRVAARYLHSKWPDVARVWVYAEDSATLLASLGKVGNR